MEHIIKKIKKGAKHTRLSVVEKAEMRNVLVRHMKANPVRSNAWGIPTTSNGAGPVIVSPFNINNFRNKKGISILVIGGLLMSGSVSLAAENTVPGDVLFSVKVHVNENVRGAVAVTSKAKAEWEVRLVERRLEEVEKLATIPNVLPGVHQVAEKNLERYAERVKNRIEKFDEDDDDEDALETASNLSNVFGEHERILSGLSEDFSKDVATSAVVAGTPDNIVVMPVEATSTTSLSNVPIANNRSIRGTLEKVRIAHDDVEKKRSTLKEKYRKNVEVTENTDTSDNHAIRVKLNSIQSVTPVKKAKVKTGASADASQAVHFDNFNDSKGSVSKKEIRSTINTPATSTTGVFVRPIELQKHDEVNRDGAHLETRKTDEND